MTRRKKKTPPKEHQYWLLHHGGYPAQVVVTNLSGRIILAQTPVFHGSTIRGWGGWGPEIATGPFDTAEEASNAPNPLARPDDPQPKRRVRAVRPAQVGNAPVHPQPAGPAGHQNDRIVIRGGRLVAEPTPLPNLNDMLVMDDPEPDPGLAEFVGQQLDRALRRGRADEFPF